MDTFKVDAISHVVTHATNMIHLSLEGHSDKGFRGDVAAIMLSLCSAIDALKAAETLDDISRIVREYESEHFEQLSLDNTHLDDGLYWRYRHLGESQHEDTVWPRFQSAIQDALEGYIPDSEIPAEI